jgi:hypothetical protein
MTDRLDPTDPTTQILARTTTAHALTQHLRHALNSDQDIHYVKGALEAIAATAIARCALYEAENVRLRDSEQGQDHSSGVPTHLPPRSTPPGPGPAGRRAMNNFRREAEKLGLGPWRGHVDNVIPIRPSVRDQIA